MRVQIDICTDTGAKRSLIQSHVLLTKPCHSIESLNMMLSNSPSSNHKKEKPSSQHSDQHELLLSQQYLNKLRFLNPYQLQSSMQRSPFSPQPGTQPWKRSLECNKKYNNESFQMTHTIAASPTLEGH